MSSTTGRQWQSVRLRRLLEQRGMRQTELQLRSGLGYSTINALFHEKTERIEFATLEKLCEVLECGVGEVLVNEKLPQREAGPEMPEAERVGGS